MPTIPNGVARSLGARDKHRQGRQQHGQDTITVYDCAIAARVQAFRQRLESLWRPFASREAPDNYNKSVVPSQVWMLEIVAGPAAGRNFRLTPGTELRVGRSAAVSEVAIESDAHLSKAHFSLSFDGGRCLLRDLNSSNGTTVNGLRAAEAQIQPGDDISAGSSRFALSRLPDLQTVPAASSAFGSGAATVIEAPKAQTIWEGYSEQQSILLSTLFASPADLCVILDAAREKRVPSLLVKADDISMSLFAGTEARDLSAVAPYIAVLKKNSSLLETIVKEGWGQGWCTFFHSGSGVEDTRRHLRSQLLTRGGDGKTLFFRFYDPRVLRAFLPVCNAQETKEFFGPVSEFVVEADPPDAALCFRNSGSGCALEAVPLAKAAKR